MALTNKLIKRFDVNKIPPQIINQLGVEKEAKSTNQSLKVLIML